MQVPLSLSIAAPAYNEAEGIQLILEKWYQFLKQQPEIAQFEIVICNDGSRDHTAEILDSLAKVYPEIRPLHFSQNQGAASALTAAIAATRFDWVLLMDSDGQFLIEDFRKLHQALTAAKADVAIGVRHKKDNFLGRFGTKISGMICNFVHRSQISDFNSAFKLVRGSLLRSLILEAKGMNYSTEITSRLLEYKASIINVDIDHQPRQLGKSNMKFIRGSVDRFLFVCYIAFRQLLFKCRILRHPQRDEQ